MLGRDHQPLPVAPDAHEVSQYRRVGLVFFGQQLQHRPLIAAGQSYPQRQHLQQRIAGVGLPRAFRLRVYLLDCPSPKTANPP